MNPILYLIYQFLKLLTKISFRVYYPRATKMGMEHLRYRGSSILVSNHPNTLLDPLNAACRVPKVVHFLANASLFQTPFGNWFFNTFFCIPVERPQDTKGKPINNRAAFAKSHNFLAGGGCLYIAPEGGSDMERRVRPFKTGVARIALGAEAAKDWQIGLRILPVGLTYDHAPRFRSRMTVNAGEPIMVRDYAEDYREDPIGTTRRLAKELEAQVRTLAIDTADEAEDQELLRMECLLRNSHPVSGEAHFRRTKQLLSAYRRWKATAPAEQDAFQKRLQLYFAELETRSSQDLALARPRQLWPLQVLALAILAPVFLYGLVNNLLAISIPYLVARKADLYIGYQATVRILVGLLVVPVSYALQTWAVSYWLPAPWAWAYLLSLPLSAWAALHYYRYSAQVAAFLRVRSQWPEGPLRKERQWLLGQVENLLSESGVD